MATARSSKLTLGPHTKFPDGRLTVTGGARVLTNRNGKDLVIVVARKPTSS